MDQQVWEVQAQGKSMSKAVRDNLAWRLKELLTIERNLTAEWYKRVSGDVPWREGEREEMEIRMGFLSTQIVALQKIVANNAGSL